MSDDLSIQQKRPSATPYFLTGAAVGGVGTYLAATKVDGLKKHVAKTFEDLVEEAKNGDKFSKTIENLTDNTQKTLLEKFKSAVKDNDGKALNECRDDIAKFLEGKFNNKKLALAVGGGAVALGLLALLFRPKNKQ